MDSLSIGSSPTDEKCAQVGQSDYAKQAKLECLRFIALLRAVHGEEPYGARLYVKSNPHDFGTYYEVECMYDEGSGEAVAYALKCEGKTPRTWMHNGIDYSQGKV